MHKDSLPIMEYLKEWRKHSKGKQNAWKFQKAKQNWILKNLYNMDKKVFKYSLKYMASIKGNLQWVQEDAIKVIKAVEEAEKVVKKESTEIDMPEDEEAKEKAEKAEKKERKRKLKRAEKVIKVIKK